MKTVSTPMEIWYTEPNLRGFIRNNNIVKEVEGRIVIPAFKCNIEKEVDGRKNQIKQYPFYHQKLQFMIDSMEGDYIRAIETFSQNRSFVCGKNLEITVTLLS